MFEPLVPLLDRDFMLIIPDLRGHGASSAMDGPYDAERSATDVVELLDHLRVPSATILGYSQGGPVCQRVAHESPARVDRLILACTYAHNTSTPREYVEGWVMTGLVSVFGARRVTGLMIREGAAIGGGPPLSLAQAAWLRGVLGSGPRAAMVAAVRGMRQFDSRPWLATITAPTLVVAGAEDEAVPKHHLEMLTGSIPRAESRVVDGAGHGLVWTHSSVFAELVRDWLQKPVAPP